MKVLCWPVVGFSRMRDDGFSRCVQLRRGDWAVGKRSCVLYFLWVSGVDGLIWPDVTASGELVPDEGSVLASSWVTSPGPVVVEVVALLISFSMCPSLFRSARACRVEVSRSDRLAGIMFLTGSNLYNCIFSLFNGPLEVKYSEDELLLLEVCLTGRPRFCLGVNWNDSSLIFNVRRSVVSSF